MYNSYKILVKLIKLADKNYGVIKYDDAFYNNFPDTPPKELFDICIHLSQKLYIDYDYCDEETLTFNKLYILPDGYKCKEAHNAHFWTTILSVVSILVALCSLCVSLMQLN